MGSGPLTIEDLRNIWIGAVDKSYSEPLLKAGDGHGMEAYNQAFAQYARVSQAINTSTQALFILPSSSQTAPSAAGDALATVQLTFARSLRLDLPLRLAAGNIFVLEQTTDWGDSGSVVVQTGRRYTLTSDLIFLPGDTGPLTVLAEAEFAGYGYNNPFPKTLQVINQPGTSFSNDFASVIVSPGPTPPVGPPPNQLVTIVSLNESDMFIPDHVGQYVLFTQGSNVGKVARITQFNAPIPPLQGSSVTIECFGSVEVSSVGAFVLGETIAFQTSGVSQGFGQLVNIAASSTAGKSRMGYVILSGVATGTSVLGLGSGATATVVAFLSNPAFVNETGTASWRILDWPSDLGVTVTNALSPTGGRIGMLDAIGKDRNIPRLNGENDTSYAKRVHQIADTVSPNAIKRSLNRNLVGMPWCFREVGLELLPGFFFDGDNSPAHLSAVSNSPNDAFDTDALYFDGIFTQGSGFPDNSFLEWRDSNNLVKMKGTNGNMPVTGTSFSTASHAGSTFDIVANDTIISVDGIFIGAGAPTAIRPIVFIPTYPRPLNVPAFVGGDTIWCVDQFGNSLNIILDIGSQIATPFGDLRRFHMIFDYTQFRAFFLVGVPKVSLGDFGFSWDVGFDGYDLTAPYNTFFDGFPVGNGAFYSRVYQDIDRIRAGGTTFDFYLSDGTCV